MSKFNLTKKVIELNINNEKYIATVDVKTISHYKQENKESFLLATQKVAELDEITIIKLLGSIIRKNEKATPVGFKFFKDFNPIAVIEKFTPMLVEVLGATLPEAKDQSEKK